MADTTININPVDITLIIAQPVIQLYPYSGTTGNLRYKPDPIEIAVTTVDGYMSEVGILLEPITVDISTYYDRKNFKTGTIFPTSYIPIAINIKNVFYYLERPSINWIWWSKPGTVDFNIDKTNLAGKLPLKWKGGIFHMAKLNNSVVVYGENGISSLSPSGIYWGLSEVSDIGIKNRGAFVGDEKVHYFVDCYDRLCMYNGSELKILDYSEYISTLGSIILSMDHETGLIFICDGTNGFVYSTRNESFGKGPGNITGLHTSYNGHYLVSPEEVVIPSFEICTDIYDLGTRKPKVIKAVEIGTDTPMKLYVSVDYRVNFKDNFKQIGWFTVNPDGKAYPKCYGVEFRFRVKSTRSEYFELDYIKIYGQIQGYEYLDTAQ